MKSIIQVTDMTGNLIEAANFEVEFSIQPSEKHEISLNFNTSDQSLISFLTKGERRGIIVDGNKDDGFTITITCDIKSIKHMVDTTELKTQSLIIVSPSNRTSEQVLLYLVNPNLCSITFLKSVRN